MKCRPLLRRFRVPFSVVKRRRGPNHLFMLCQADWTRRGVFVWWQGANSFRICCGNRDPRVRKTLG